MIDKNFKDMIGSCISLLKIVMPDKNDDYETFDWMSNCIKCLQFYFDNEWKLEENSKFKSDITNIIALVYAFIFDGEFYAFIELREKFKTKYSGKQAGEAIKKIMNRISEVHK